jgi:hypothetical protein
MPNRKEGIVSNNPGSCPECDKFRVCTEMCEEVQLWSDQDYVGRNSNLVLENGNKSDFSYGDNFLDLVNSTRQPGYHERDSSGSQDAWSVIASMRLSERVVRFIYSYYMLGKRIRDIAIDEGATSQAIDQRRLQSLRSVKSHLDRRGLWVDRRDTFKYKSISNYDISYMFFREGYPKKSIARLTGLHVSTVIKIISNKKRMLEEDGENGG